MMIPAENDPRPLVGISACLAGQRVRYDGRDKFSSAVAEQIAPHCRLLAFCPEAVAGMGIPRPPVNLIQTSDGIRAVGRDAPHQDVTDRLQTVALAFANSYPQLCGFILQSRSPSCGLDSTPVYDPAQQQILDPNGSGVFARHLRQRFPDLPLLEDTHLTSERIALFLEQVRERACRWAALAAPPSA